MAKLSKFFSIRYIRIINSIKGRKMIIMNKEELAKLAIPGVIGAATGGLAIGLIKVMTKVEVNKKTQELQKQIKELRKFTENTEKDLNEFKEESEIKEKETIRSLTPDDLALQIKKKCADTYSLAMKNMRIETTDKIKQYSDYMMDKIDEAYDRLEKTEKYVELVGQKALGDKVQEVIDEVCVETKSEENVAEKVEKTSDTENKTGNKKKKSGNNKTK